MNANQSTPTATPVKPVTKANPDTTWRKAIRAARDYASSLRNPKRKQYAFDYIFWRVGPERQTEKPPTSDLPYMASQGIRLAVDEILEAR